MNSPSQAGKPRRALSSRVVLSALVVATILLVGGFFFAYRMMMHYERVGARHLPPDTTVALRVDLQQVVLFEPLRRHLLPLVKDGPQGSTRTQRLKQYAGVVPGRDLREAVVGFGGNFSDWVVIFGGTFPKEGVVPGLAKTFQEEGFPSLAPDASGHLRLPFLPVSAGQASDGVVVFAANPERLGQALRANQHYQSLGLEPEGPFGLAVSSSVLSGLKPPPGLPLAVDLSAAKAATGRVSLAEGVAFFLDFECHSEAKAKQLGAELTQSLKALSGLGALVSRSFGGVGEVLSRAQVAGIQGKTVTARADFSREEVDQAAEQLAAWLRRLDGT